MLREQNHITSLDGLRGVAVILVFAFHTIGQTSSPQGLVWRFFHTIATLGFSGVDLFFVLSGFLITRILLSNKDASNFYRAFYWRRALRIFPLYYAAIAIRFLIMPAMGLNIQHVPWKTQIWFWLNLSNFRTAFAPTLVAPLGHFWTLAIEEQFYFIWPTVVRNCTNKSLKVICLCGAIIPLLLRQSHLFPTSYGYNFFERITIFHIEGLFLGAGIALLEFEQTKPSTARRWALACGIVGLVGIMLYKVIGSPSLSLAQVTAFSLFYACIVAFCVFQNRGVTRLFSLQPLRSVGKYSYFIYVFHVMAIDCGLHIFKKMTLVQVATIMAPTTFLITYLLGMASWKWVEEPLLSLKRVCPYRTPKIKIHA